MEQIRLQLGNKGYLNAEVDTVVDKKDRKASVTYKVTGNEPYLVRTFRDSIYSVDSTIYKILDEKKLLNVIKEGDAFDMEVLENGRIKITNELRNNGYYNFSKENFYFLADTTVGTHQVDLTLGLNNPTDNLCTAVQVGDVIVNTESVLPFYRTVPVHYRWIPSIQGCESVQERDKFMRPAAIFYNTFIRPTRVYSDQLVERTYSSLNRLGSVSQTAINLTPVVVNDSNYINANISIYPGNMHFMQFGIDGTHAAGDLGIATDATYEHKNILKEGGKLFASS